MKLSIIIPIFNTEVEEFKKCIESIYKLKNLEFEVIIIDDGSKNEKSIEYENFLEQYRNVTYIKIKNSGVSNARNQGLKMAKGEYILFVDSDDRLNYENISYEYLNNYDIVCGDLLHFTEQKVTLKKELGFDYAGEVNYKDVLRDMIHNNNFLMPTAKFIKRSFIVKNQLMFNTNFIQGEDALFNMCMLDCKPSLFYLNKPIYYYRFTTCNYEKRWDKNHEILLKNFYDKYEIESKIILLNDLYWELHSIVSEKVVRHIFRMALVNASSNDKAIKSFNEYLKKFSINKKELSIKSLLLYKILEKNNNCIIRILGLARKAYIKVKY